MVSENVESGSALARVERFLREVARLRALVKANFGFRVRLVHGGMGGPGFFDPLTELVSGKI